MDVHHSSGVFNKAFYNLATTSGWTTRKAFDVFVKANQVYWTSSTNYQAGAEGAIDAAAALGYSTADVAAAFAGVCITVDGGGGGGGVTELSNGQSVSISDSTGGWKYYKVTLASGDSNLRVTTSGSDPDADLYVRQGSQPTTSAYDCRSYTSSSNETCTTASPGAGEWFIGVYAYSSYNSLTLSVSWDGGGGGNVPPSASFSSTTSGLTANFTDTSTDSDGSIASRAWTFGDNGTSSSTNPSHAYSAGGTYSVTLTVTDNEGATDSATASVTVSGGGGGGCGSGTTSYTGSLSGSGDSDVQPNGTYFQNTDGSVSGHLEGPSGADFDLELYKWNGSWQKVAEGISSNSIEDVSYSGTGYYYFKVVSYSGSGSYELCIND